MGFIGTMHSEPLLRSDYKAVQKWRRDYRSPDRLLAHYTLELRLAEQLRTAVADERPSVYARVYDELCTSLPDHPKRTNRREPTDAAVQRQIRHIAPYLHRNVSFVELGCGDSAVSLAIAGTVRDVVGIDVQDQLVDLSVAPANFRFVRSNDGVTIPLETGSVDVVFSDQLIEHLHPDDARAQAREVQRILKKGGVYICSTPSSLTGPHDISMFFDYSARGLHLKEYDYRELLRLFEAAGFEKVRFVSYSKFGRLPVPAAVGICLELVLHALPAATRARIARTRVAERLLGINVIATK